MSFVFRGTRSDIESGFPGFVRERSALRIHAARPVNTNFLVFLFTVLLLFMVLNSQQMSPNFLLWLVVGVFLMATSFRMYATCQQPQAQARAHAAAASGLLGNTELRLHMPPSIAFATRGRLQGLRLQLALLDREFDDLDYETLRALDSDNASATPSMSEEEINALPVRKYKVIGPQIENSSLQQASSSASPEDVKQDSKKDDVNMKVSEDELTCSICLEQVNGGEIVRSLPCLHQFHANCIDPWLRQQGTCPVCKFRVGSGWQESGDNDVDVADMAASYKLAGFQAQLDATLTQGPLESIVERGISAVIVNQSRGHGGHEDEGDSSADNLHSKGLILVKVWCLIILLVSTFAGGVSPYFCRWNESFLLLGTQFAGGVFLGTSLMHFLSDSNSTFEDLSTKEYPFAFMLASSGYLLTMLGDCIVIFVTKGGHRGDKVMVDEEGVRGEWGDQQPEKEAGVNPAFLKTTSYGDTILLILALCFHSVFEGIAVGVADSKADAWRNLWTISLHKIFAAIAMGIALLRMIPKRPFLATVAYSFAFAISSPIGVGIGIAIDATTQGRVADWIYAISMGLACGVFIYVAINHLIGNGYKPQAQSYFDTPFFKFLAVLVGVGVIAVVMIWD